MAIRIHPIALPGCRDAINHPMTEKQSSARETANSAADPPPPQSPALCGSWVTHPSTLPATNSTNVDTMNIKGTRATFMPREYGQLPSLERYEPAGKRARKPLGLLAELA